MYYGRFRGSGVRIKDRFKLQVASFKLNDAGFKNSSVRGVKGDRNLDLGFWNLVIVSSFVLSIWDLSVICCLYGKLAFM